jgi:hypothetical protein
MLKPPRWYYFWKLSFLDANTLCYHFGRCHICYHLCYHFCYNFVLYFLDVIILGYHFMLLFYVIICVIILCYYLCYHFVLSFLDVVICVIIFVIILCYHFLLSFPPFFIFVENMTHSYYEYHFPLIVLSRTAAAELDICGGPKVSQTLKADCSLFTVLAIF